MSLTDKIAPTPLQSYKAWFQDGKRYPGQHWRLMLESIAGEANCPIGNDDLQVVSTQTDLTVQVSKGRGWIYATESYGGVYLAEVTDSFPVKFGEVASGMKRCDLVCLQVIDPDVQTSSDDSHSLGYVVIPGTESKTGDKPVVPQEQDVALLPLAYVHLDEAGTIDAEDIDDVRFAVDPKLNLKNKSATTLADAYPAPKDTGWVALIPAGIAKADPDNLPQARQIGNDVYVRGVLMGPTPGKPDCFKLPSEIAPPQYKVPVAVATGQPSSSAAVTRLELSAAGNARIYHPSSVELGTWISLHFHYRTD